jgi:hypothetical protein
MPYEVSFMKKVEIADREEYINECCIGGDLVVNQLLPAVRVRYADIQTNQEDWGWFIWFREGQVKLAIDVFTEDPDQGLFRLHLTSRTRRLLLFDKVVDTPELEDLRTLVQTELTAWAGDTVRVRHLDSNYIDENEDL